MTLSDFGMLGQCWRDRRESKRGETEKEIQIEAEERREKRERKGEKPREEKERN